jgi:hypothetical protein
MKFCPRCQTEKSLDEFYRDRTRGHLDGRSSYCKSCTTERQRERRHAGKIDYRKYNIKQKYGLSLEELDEMVLLRQNLCEICGSLFDPVPHIDHDHETGEIRGLLCSPCNKGLGHFRDNEVLLERAQEYLARYKNGRRMVITTGDSSTGV